jgi:microcin C transport system substrate-binding protein
MLIGFTHADRAMIRIFATIIVAAVSSFSASVWAAHAFSLYDTPKYSPQFTHFDYLNPDAPKGGELYLANPDSRTSFDKFNPFSMKLLKLPYLKLIFIQISNA